MITIHQQENVRLPVLQEDVFPVQIYWLAAWQTLYHGSSRDDNVCKYLYTHQNYQARGCVVLPQPGFMSITSNFAPLLVLRRYILVLESIRIQ